MSFCQLALQDHDKFHKGQSCLLGEFGQLSHYGNFLLVLLDHQILEIRLQIQEADKMAGFLEVIQHGVHLTGGNKKEENLMGTHLL